MQHLNRRSLTRGLVAGLLAAAAVLPAAAQDGAPAKIIVGFPAGSAPALRGLLAWGGPATSGRVGACGHLAKLG